MKQEQCVMVTGAARGIGRAITERMVTDGYRVLAIDLDPEVGISWSNTLAGESVTWIKADISCENDVKRIFSVMKKEFGSLDVLVNNAGILRDKLIDRMDVADFDQVLSVNLRGAWLMCRSAAEGMKASNKGRIINIASRAWLGNSGQSNYAASKAGLVALTRVLALELGPYNVLVNTIAPGLIDTPMTRGLKQEVLERLIQAQPTRTMGQPEDVAHAVAFLASPQTCFITGQLLYVDGGKSIGAGI